MEETLHKPPYNHLTYDQLTKLINSAYTDDQNIRAIARKFDVPVSVVLEMTGWKDYLDFVVDRD